jgi:site-specific recombinase XerD
LVASVSRNSASMNSDTWATLLLRWGIHVKIVQETVGHRQISLTVDMYSHVLPTMQVLATRTMERILSDPAEVLTQF